ncbi:MAG: hypothetical protein JWM36_3091 [Hyphomicrobiales bacterium]|nr:hypothetical protein [Hyphomicrobiales bacterium]
MPKQAQNRIGLASGALGLDRVEESDELLMLARYIATDRAAGAATGQRRRPDLYAIMTHPQKHWTWEGCLTVLA